MSFYRIMVWQRCCHAQSLAIPLMSQDCELSKLSLKACETVPDCGTLHLRSTVLCLDFDQRTVISCGAMEKY